MKLKLDLWSIPLGAICLVVYLIPRVYSSLTFMNEYFDYDEGTYLLIARYINHGVLPYRDILAVHPPLYYYLLALWMRIFGDSYVVGRLLSMFLGLIAVVVAYFVGMELRGWKTGILFSLMVAMDPIMVHMNSLVFHETTIELFTLLSLYHFVKYQKSRGEKHALLSLFWAGLGSTSKFTILPYAAALYVVLLLCLDEKTEEYLQKSMDVLLNRIQLFVLFTVYAIMTIVVIDAVMIQPSEEVRKLLIVPGVNKIEIIGHVISTGLFLLMWGLLTLYIFRISYLSKVTYTIRALMTNVKKALIYLGAFLFPKLIVEGILGMAVSSSYFSQTYGAQGARYIPLAGFSDFLFNFIKNLSREKPDFLVFYVPILLVAFFVLFQWDRGVKLRKPSKVGPLFLTSAFMYLVIFPIIPNPRFIYPMFLTLYLTFLESVSWNKDVKVNKRQFGAVVIALILIIGIADYGVAYQYKKGKLLLAWASHSKDLRDNLGQYIQANNLSGVYLSVNPFNAYYLNLNIDPYYLDTFGLVYLNNSTKFWEVVNESDYLLFSTWMYTMMLESDVFMKTFGAVKKSAVTNATLLYAESYKKGDVIELFDTRETNFHDVGFSSFLGKLQLWINMSNTAYVYLVENETNFTDRTIVMLKDEKYIVQQFSNDNRKVEFTLTLIDNGIVLRFNSSRDVTFEFISPSVVLSGDKRAVPGENGTFRVFTPNVTFEIITDGSVSRSSSEVFKIEGCTFVEIRGG